MVASSTPVIRTSGSEFIGPYGEPLLLRGVCLGGWLNMENFITGYAANETLMRREVRAVIGDDRADPFFERLQKPPRPPSHPTPRRPLRGAPPLPGPGRAHLGGHRRPLPGQPVGGGLQPAERARRRVPQRRRTVLPAAGIGHPRGRPGTRRLPRRQHLRDRV